MTNTQFEIIDELYFINSFDELRSKLDLNDTVLKVELRELIKIGWVKCVDLHDGNDIPAPADALAHPEAYHYLATKAGLMAHNLK